MDNNQAISKILEHRKYVLREFIESEREYVRRLHMAIEDYYNHIKFGISENISVELKNDSLTIFSTMPDIYAFHKSIFLPALEGCDWEEDADAVVECFLKHSSEFKIYLAFCKNKPTSDSVRVDYDKYFSCRQIEIGERLGIDDLLIAPVQRLPKYQLLIKDLLKDTRKAQFHSAKIEEALELMMKIPKDTNNIICMSLIRGISRAGILSHGSLWRQDTLSFSSFSSNEEVMSSVSSRSSVKMEPRQIFLFDHRILIAAPVDRDGFYDYQMDLKTLNGRVTEVANDLLTFSFTTENNTMCFFKANNESSRKNWISDVRAILESQSQMKKALVFGKSPLGRGKMVRMHSLSVEWSDSDSSVDSLPSSVDEDEDHEYDWPEQTGFKNVNKSVTKSPLPLIAVPTMKEKKKKRKKLRKTPNFDTRPQRVSESCVPTMNHHLMLTRPHSYHAESLAHFDQRTSHTLSISPRMLRHWVTRKLSMQSNEAYIYFPTQRLPSFQSIRSSGSRRDSIPAPPSEVLFIARDDPPAVAEQVYTPRPGQVFCMEDDSSVDVWKAKVLSGDNAGSSVWVQRNCLKEYSAPISIQSLKKSYLVLNILSIGRYAKVKLARSKSSKELHSLKVFHGGFPEDQMYRELCIGTRMKHKNLVCYYVGFHKPNLAISMDYINGHPILDYLTHKAFITEKMVVNLMRQLLDGLHYMHSHTVYHLDMRPENVLIDLTTDVLKIIDYGAARHSGDVDDILSQNFETCFKYDYIAPEVFQQNPVGPGTDIWGVGIILYIIFHGCTPFSGETPVRIIANITSLCGGDLFLDSSQELSCSQRAIQLMKDMLALSPSQRPSAEVAGQSSWFTDTDQDFLKIKVNLYRLKQFVLKSI